MDNPRFQQHGGPHAAEHRPHHKPMHRGFFFWIAAFILMGAMTVYVLTNNLATAPSRNAMPAVAP
jgi:hypothetical protein